MEFVITETALDVSHTHNIGLRIRTHLWRQGQFRLYGYGQQNGGLARLEPLEGHNRPSQWFIESWNFFQVLPGVAIRRDEFGQVVPCSC